jgi:hypothetical protein
MKMIENEILHLYWSPMIGRFLDIDSGQPLSSPPADFICPREEWNSTLRPVVLKLMNYRKELRSKSYSRLIAIPPEFFEKAEIFYLGVDDIRFYQTNVFDGIYRTDLIQMFDCTSGEKRTLRGVIHLTYLGGEDLNPEFNNPAPPWEK